MTDEFASLAACLAVAGETAICFLTVPFFFIGLGPTFLDSGSQTYLNGSPKNLHTTLVRGQALNLKLPSKTFLPTPKKFGVGKTQKFRQSLSVRTQKRVTSKWLNISTNK